ncbi:6219_t:CDS:2 [Paraglomus brasilianum]|uniref:6219_t:CDS:1 n=1 Tax=Paraglomus brasilianum TaxID=144538 RepID=A0A9N9GUV3_9GLOM|nr:6219_t:CDS:2 [Paraglomus brasilianum]
MLELGEKRMETRRTLFLYGAIIGGGYGGVPTAQKLEAALHKTHRIILIERKTHYWHSVGAPRTVAEDNFESQLLIPYDNLFKHDGKIIHAAAVRLSDNEMTLDKAVDEFGDKVPFKYAVIATGSDSAKPAKIDGRSKKEIVKKVDTYRSAVKKATRALIIGGGSVGIDQATVRLRALGVNVILNKRVQFSASDIGNGDNKVTLVTDKGTKIESDVQLIATGNHVNSELAGCEHVFALGDVNNVKETKMTLRAGLQADLVAKNIIALIGEKKLVEYNPGPPVMLLTLGKDGGVGLLPMFGGILAGNWMAKLFKSKNLFVNKYWKEIAGELPPSLENNTSGDARMDLRIFLLVIPLLYVGKVIFDKGS